MSIIQSSFAYNSDPNHDDIISDGESYFPSISGDGNYVVYASGASNLVIGDTNNASDVFLYNRITNHIDIISVTDTGEPANSFSYISTVGRQISADGRYSVFYSYATNLVADPNADGSYANIYIYDRDAPLHHISRIPTERIIDFGNTAHQIIHTLMSPDGSSVFLSDDTGNLFKYDLFHDSFEQIPIGAGIGEFSLSENGKYIAYDFLSGYARGIYVYNLVDHTTQTVISGEQIGTLLSYAGTAIHPTISADGRYVAFELIGPFANIGNNSPEVYLWDRESNFPPVLVSHGPDGGLQNADEAHTNLSPIVTSDGHYVLFGSDASDLGGGFAGSANLYSYNVLDGTVTFLYGPTPAHHDYQISASYDGRYVSFTTSDGVYGYITGRDVFVLDQGPVAINHPPAASNISANANEDTNVLPVTLAALFMDPDLSDTFRLTFDPTGTKGTVTDNNDGTFTYDPNGKFESLGLGETATDTFTYTVTDNHGASSTTVATVTVHGENDIPDALPDVAAVTARGTVTVNAVQGVLADDHDPDTDDMLHVSTIGVGNTSISVTPNGLATINGAFGKLTLSADGSYSYRAGTKSGQDIFTYTVDDGHGGKATSALVVTVQASGTVNIDSAGLQTAAKLFSKYGPDGEVVTLAQLAQAAYHLVPGIEKLGSGINVPSAAAEAAYALLPSGMQVLTPSELPSLMPHAVPGHPDFPTFGLIDGMYLNGNAAAFIAHSSDSLFISFRGTNDLELNSFQGTVDQLFSGPSPDTQDWSPSGMSVYYDLFKPLITVIDGYLATHDKITHVYVTGHSLGASMAQNFMSDHAGNKYEAITFANPGFASSGSADDPRITNFVISTDPVPFKYSVNGDVYQIVDYDGHSGGGLVGPHDMTLYRDAVQFLSLQQDNVPQLGLAADGHQDLVKIFADITHPGPSDVLQTDPWSISPPTGVVPLPFGILPNFDPRTDRTIAPKEILGVTNGGTLTGGPGNDTFTFDRGFGEVTITNFRPGEDMIQIDHALFGSAKSVLANTHDVDGHALITYDANDTISLLNVTTSQLHLHSADYYFHIV
ncbi:Ig-like domain-containing protein [Bradyrhizobium sp. USDA 4520]